MSSLIGLGFFILLIVGVIYGLSLLNKPYKVTEEEYENRVNEGPGLLGAGLIGLQKAIDPAAAKAEAVVQDFKAGHLDKKQESGDGSEDEEGEKGRKGEGEI
jgi:hypothetical protein